MSIIFSFLSFCFILHFPYLAAKYGGGSFLVDYLILTVTFGFTHMLAEVAIRRKTGLSAIGAFKSLDKHFGFLGILGVEKGIENASKILMSVLIVLTLFIAIYSCSIDGATEGSVRQIELFDTGIAFLAGLMVIPGVFAFSGGDKSALSAGPGLMFITLPKVFNGMPMGGVIGTVFFIPVLFAALTSSLGFGVLAHITLGGMTITVMIKCIDPWFLPAILISSIASALGIFYLCYRFSPIQNTATTPGPV